MVKSSLVFAGIAPHPPIMVPEVGGSAISEVRSSIDAMKILTQRVKASGAETVILISPHAPLDARAFVAYRGEKLHGSFARFQAPGSIVEASLDENLLSAIRSTASDSGLKVVDIERYELDHGTMVPLYFLQLNGWQGSVVCLGYSSLSNDDHLKFGSCIRAAVDSGSRRVAIIASGDLSHRLKPGAPAGYSESAHLFDAEITQAVDECDPDRIINVDSELRYTAGECGYRSMLVALGSTDGLPRSYELLSYEAPFGVGYMVAQLACDLSSDSEGAQVGSLQAAVKSSGMDPAALARTTVETFVRESRRINPTSRKLNYRAACFVSIKTVSGELRGCVGTVEPNRNSLQEEIIANAINAATRDIRFTAIRAEELPLLRYSVDVLSEVEPTNIEDLDARCFGVVVEDLSINRRGVLLPNLAGVDTVEQQVAIAMRKAGIQPGSPINLFRFRVSRFRESEPGRIDETKD